jgi:D-amino-acid oxidase
MSARFDAVVVGAGVIGLTTGIRLAEADHRVTIVSADDPTQTTSVLATAMVGPTFGFNGPRATEWEAETVATFLATVDAPGVQQCRGRFIARPAGFVPPGADELPGFSLCAAPDMPVGYETAFWADVPLVDMPRYVRYLVKRFENGGGELRRGTIESLAQAAALAPLVANCTGLGARDLVPDPEVVPLRGPKIVVANPGIDTFLIAGPPGPEGTSYHPHGDVVVLGGSATGSFDTTPDPDEEAAIIARCAAIEPRLRDAKVIEHRVGLRPARPQVRLESEQIGRSTVVHNYGHGGVGVTLSWGCATETLRRLTE